MPRQHAGEDLEAQILLVAQAVGAPRNISHGTSALIETNGSPFADSSDKRFGVDRKRLNRGDGHRDWIWRG